MEKWLLSSSLAQHLVEGQGQGVTIVYCCSKLKADLAERQNFPQDVTAPEGFRALSEPERIAVQGLVALSNLMKTVALLLELMEHSQCQAVSGASGLQPKDLGHGDSISRPFLTPHKCRSPPGNKEF